MENTAYKDEDALAVDASVAQKLNEIRRGLFQGKEVDVAKINLVTLEFCVGKGAKSSMFGGDEELVGLLLEGMFGMAEDPNFCTLLYVREEGERVPMTRSSLYQIHQAEIRAAAAGIKLFPSR